MPFFSAVTRHDSRHQLVIVNRNTSSSFPEGADYPTCLASILVRGVVYCRAHFFFNLFATSENKA